MKQVHKLWGNSIDSFIKLEEELKNRNHAEEDSVEKSGRILTREIAIKKYLLKELFKKKRFFILVCI
jgi:hypothetical protein